MLTKSPVLYRPTRECCPENGSSARRGQPFTFSWKMAVSYTRFEYVQKHHCVDKMNVRPGEWQKRYQYTKTAARCEARKTHLKDDSRYCRVHEKRYRERHGDMLVLDPSQNAGLLVNRIRRPGRGAMSRSRVDDIGLSSRQRVQPVSLTASQPFNQRHRTGGKGTR